MPSIFNVEFLKELFQHKKFENYKFEFFMEHCGKIIGQEIPGVLTSKTKILNYIRNEVLPKTPSQGRRTKAYWQSRGWTDAEIYVKLKQLPKLKIDSAFNYKTYMKKFGMTEAEARYEANSRRPIRKEYWMKMGYSESESIDLARVHKSSNNRRGLAASVEKRMSNPDLAKMYTPMTIEYWTQVRGVSEQQAKQNIRERQKTFTKEKCIQKYGEEEGLRVWQDRQDRWLASFYDRSDEEMEEIHRKKSTRVNFKSLWAQELTGDGIFYLLRLANGCVKIGITSRTMDERYKSDDNHQIIAVYEGSIQHVFAMEQLLRRELGDYTIRRSEKFLEYGWTETFRGVDIQLLIERCDDIFLIPTDELFSYIEMM